MTPYSPSQRDKEIYLDIFSLVLVVMLIAITAFFVASEFAIVKIRSSRIDQLIEEGSKRAVAAKTLITHLDEYLSACQLGITITALGLGWLGEPAVGRMLHPIFESMNLADSVQHILSVGIAFALITFIHVVVGELAPKSFAIQKAEAITLFVAQPLIWFYRIMFPFIWLLNGSSRLVTRIFGLNPTSESELAHSEEELRILLSESYKSGEINQSEYKYVNNIFEFGDRIAKEIMVPRTEIISLSKDETIESFIKTVKEEKFTRYPIIDGDKDHIIGLVNLKEILTDYVQNQENIQQTLESYVRPIIRVIDTIPIHDLLIKMQKEQIHMAVLMDEYGGTAGLVTVEDILEEIVGEIRDEFDLDEVPLIRKINEHHFILDAKVLVSEVNDLLGLEIEEEDVDTIGGWVLTKNYDASQGDVIFYENYEFRILDMEDHHIKYIEVLRKESPEEQIAPAKQISLAENEAIS